MHLNINGHFMIVISQKKKVNCCGYGLARRHHHLQERSKNLAETTVHVNVHLQSLNYYCQYTKTADADECVVFYPGRPASPLHGSAVSAGSRQPRHRRTHMRSPSTVCPRTYKQAPPFPRLSRSRATGCGIRQACRSPWWLLGWVLPVPASGASSASSRVGNNGFL